MSGILLNRARNRRRNAKSIEKRWRSPRSPRLIRFRLFTTLRITTTPSPLPPSSVSVSVYSRVSVFFTPSLAAVFCDVLLSVLSVCFFPFYSCTWRWLSRRSFPPFDPNIRVKLNTDYRALIYTSVDNGEVEGGGVNGRSKNMQDGWTFGSSLDTRESSVQSSATNKLNFIF